MKGTLIMTGGSRGIGESIAYLAAERGYAVCLSYVNRQDAAEKVVATIQASGGVASAVQAEVSNEQAIQKLFDTAEHLAPLIGLVNNAGITGKINKLADTSADELRRVLEINVLGVLLCSREAVRRMSIGRGGTGGSIVNISSRATAYGSPNEFVHYAASKAAIDTLTFGLAAEVGNEGIRVNCVSPGMIYTEIHALAGDAGRAERIVPRIPLQRVGKPEEVAAAVLWLLSEEASYCTGTTIAVGGGR